MSSPASASSPTFSITYFFGLLYVDNRLAAGAMRPPSPTTTVHQPIRIRKECSTRIDLLYISSFTVTARRCVFRSRSLFRCYRCCAIVSCQPLRSTLKLIVLLTPVSFFSFLFVRFFLSASVQCRIDRRIMPSSRCRQRYAHHRKPSSALKLYNLSSLPH